MGGQVEQPRVGLRERAKKHLSSFIYSNSKSPKRELKSGGSRPDGKDSVNGSSDGSFYSATSEMENLERGSRQSTEFDPLQRLKGSSAEVSASSQAKEGAAGTAAAAAADSSAADSSRETIPPSPWPEEFICPISKLLMADPVIIESGTTYERRNVQAYLHLGHNQRYKTQETPEHQHMVKNSALKKAIDNWCDSHQVPRPVAPDEGTARIIVEQAFGLGKAADDSDNNKPNDSDNTNPNPDPALTSTSAALTELRLSSSQAASSSDSNVASGSGSSGIQPVSSDAPPPSRSRTWNSSNSNWRPVGQIPEAVPESDHHTADGGNEGLSPTADWYPSLESMLDRQHHTWSGVKPLGARKLAEQASSSKDASSSLSGNENSSTEGDRRQWRSSSSSGGNIGGNGVGGGGGGGGGGAVPLPLATKPAAFTKQHRMSSRCLLPGPVENWDESISRGLIQKLQQQSQPLDQEEAVAEIRKLSRVSSENRVALCDHVLEDLLPLVQSRYSGVQINAMAAVMNLSLEKENKLKVARSGGIPLLIDVLKSGPPEAQEHAAGALFSLALNDDNKMAIGVLGGIPPLIYVLRTGQRGTRRDAAMALYHLSFSQLNRSKLIKAGGVETFLGIARDEKSDVVSGVLLILCNIAAISDGRAAIAKMNGVQVMVGLLTRGGDKDDADNAELLEDGREQKEESSSTSSKVNWAEVREQAAATLLQLSHHNLRFKGQAVQAGAIEGLQRLLEEGTPRAREKATALLSILRDTPAVAEIDEDIPALYHRAAFGRPSWAGGADDKADSAQF